MDAPIRERSGIIRPARPRDDGRERCTACGSGIDPHTGECAGCSD